jgi:hypothetical protein
VAAVFTGDRVHKPPDDALFHGPRFCHRGGRNAASQPLALRAF